MKIGLVATSSRFDRAVAEEVTALAAGLYPKGVELVVHPDSFLVHGHFAGDDQARASAFLDIANDDS
ncbi:MAG: LD-carboxypeptidase, partial [Caulobacteraceae bacterium]